MDRKTAITYPDGSAVTMTYGFEEGAFSTRTRDQEGKQKTVLKDVRGNITAVKELCGGMWNATRYAYDPLGQITKVTDAAGNSTRIEYDGLGRRVSIDNPDAGLVEYRYDHAGNLGRKITPNLRAQGKYIQYFYTYNRLERIDYPDMADVLYTYGAPGAGNNGAGRVIAVDNGVMKEKREYGRLGEVVKSVRTASITVPSKATKTFTTAYAYNNLGQMERMVYPDGEALSYGYDYGGQLMSASGTKGGVTEQYVKDIAYDEFGSRTSALYGNGAASEYAYDPLTRRLTSLRFVSTKLTPFFMLHYLTVPSSD